MRLASATILLAMVLATPLASATDSSDEGEGYHSVMARCPADPADTPLDTLAFTKVKLTVIASEITLGVDGPRLPVFFSYSPDGTDVHLHQFADGKSVQVGATEEASFNSSVNGFTLVARCRDHVISGTDSNCMILRNHDDLNGFLDRHHIQPAFGHQLSIMTILKPYMDADKHLVLTNTQRIALFELGTHDPLSPAYDFQDLVLLLDFSQPKAYHRNDF